MCPSRRRGSGSSAAPRAESGTAAGQAPQSRGTPSMRASDAEREAAAGELRLHAAAGRLDADELDARLEAALGARTRADIAAALADLPRATADARRERTPARRGDRELYAYAAVMALLLTIWLLTGAGHFWPLYPALGWGLPLLAGRRAGAHGAQRPGATAARRA